MEGVTLYKGDCLEIMRSIPDGSIDMVLCDLPYGTTNNSWNKPLPFKELWDIYRRVIKNNGAIILFGQSTYSANLILSSKELYRYTLIWEKTIAGGFLNARRIPLQAHEDILVFYKKLPTYNPKMQTGKPYSKIYVTNGVSDSYGRFERVGTTLSNQGT